MHEFLPLSEVDQTFPLLLKRELVRLQWDKDFGADICPFFSKKRQTGLFGEHLPECSSLAHWCEVQGGSRVWSCGSWERAFVCLQLPGMGGDVKIACVWLYGIMSLKDFHDPVVQKAL